MVLILSGLLLAVHLAGAGVLIWRTRWKDYPAFMSYLAYSIVAGALALNPQWFTFVVTAGLPVGMVLRCWMVTEDYQQTRSQWPRREAVITGLLALGLAALASVGTWLLDDRPPINDLFAAGQYLMLALMGCAWAITIRAHWWPMLERRRNRAYRWGVTAILTVLGLSSMCARYGLGDYGEAAWQAVRLAVTGSLALAIAAMVVGMAWPEHVKRAARIAGCSKRSNVVEIGRAA